MPRPPADPEPGTIAEAVAIAAGETVAGTLSSPTDVDFFRLRLAGPGTVTVWTTGAAETVVTLRDGDGNDLSAAGGSAAARPAGSGAALAVAAVPAASEGRVSVTTEVDDVFVEVTGQQGGSAGEYTLYHEFAENLAPRVLRAFTGVSIPAGGSPVTVDLSNVFEDPEGGRLTFSADLPAGQVGPVRLGVTISGSIMSITSPAGLQPGPVSISVKASDPLEAFVVEVLTVTVTPAATTPVSDWADCVDVSRRSVDQSTCSRLYGGGASYTATFTNMCDVGLRIHYEWSEHNVNLPGSSSYRATNAGPGGTAFSGTSCVLSGAPTLKVCVAPADVRHEDNDRCYGPANYRTY